MMYGIKSAKSVGLTQGKAHPQGREIKHVGSAETL